MSAYPAITVSRLLKSCANAREDAALDVHGVGAELPHMVGCALEEIFEEDRIGGAHCAAC
jgi:hypothetical protein